MLDYIFHPYKYIGDAEGLEIFDDNELKYASSEYKIWYFLGQSIIWINTSLVKNHDKR